MWLISMILKSTIKTKDLNLNGSKNKLFCWLELKNHGNQNDFILGSLFVTKISNSEF